MIAKAACREIIDILKVEEAANVGEIKKDIAKRYNLKRIPANSEVLRHLKAGERELLLPVLRRKPIRTISGIAVVAVMARPYECPGKCIYCPRGENAPQSYTGEEPAALRARRANYDPYIQVSDRLSQLKQIGHAIDKVELVVMGGTFTAQPADYQEWFVSRCLEAMNSFGLKTGGKERPLGQTQKTNEKASVRNVGITFETRPDFAKAAHVDKMLAFGATRVELGVQTIYDEIYKKIRRGHRVADVVDATQILKDSGMKVGYHMMPGLFSDAAQDLRIFRKIFEHENFKPDFVKIYPALVVKGTRLYDMWKRGEFRPYTDEEAVELIVRIKRRMPKWVRTMRIQRDIPSRLIEAGVKKSDLGELVYRKVRGKCKCIRCREIGHLAYKEGVQVQDRDLQILDEAYKASGGDEHFITIEDLKKSALVAYLRLRFPSLNAHRKEIDEKTALIRELRVLGQTVPIGERIRGAAQHKGLGSALLKKAEELSAESGKEKVLVTSAIGTREYYRKFGYHRAGPYMGKSV